MQKSVLILLLGFLTLSVSCTKKTAAVVSKTEAQASTGNNTASTSGTTKSVSSDAKAIEVLNAYIDAIGGKEKLKGVKSMMTKMSASTGMGDLVITQYVKDGKSAMKTEMAGSVVMEQIFDGSTLQMSGMGGTQKMTDEASIKGARKQARLFDELDQLMTDKSIKKYLGTEDLNGKKVHKVMVTDEDKNSTTQYFDVVTNLLVRTVSKTDVMGQTAEQTMDMDNYQDVSGVKFPHSIKLTGGSVPFPLDLKITAMMMNSDLPDELFKIN